MHRINDTRRPAGCSPAPATHHSVKARHELSGYAPGRVLLAVRLRWWNTERIHGYLHDLSPDQFETAYAAANTDHTRTENQNTQPAQNPG